MRYVLVLGLMCIAGCEQVVQEVRSTSKLVADFKGKRFTLKDGDCRTIKSLNNIEFVKKLAAARQGGNGMTFLVTYINPEAARVLAGVQCSQLNLNLVTHIDTETAIALANFKGSLGLNGLTYLSQEVGEALAKFDGKYLQLYGLDRLTPKLVPVLRANSKIQMKY